MELPIHPVNILDNRLNFEETKYDWSVLEKEYIYEGCPKSS